MIAPSGGGVERHDLAGDDRVGTIVFGRDVVEGTSAQYALKSAELAARRDAVAAPAKVPQRA